MFLWIPADKGLTSQFQNMTSSHLTEKSWLKPSVRPWREETITEEWGEVCLCGRGIRGECRVVMVTMMPLTGSEPAEASGNEYKKSVKKTSNLDMSEKERRVWKHLGFYSLHLSERGKPISEAEASSPSSSVALQRPGESQRKVEELEKEIRTSCHHFRTFAPSGLTVSIPPEAWSWRRGQTWESGHMLGHELDKKSIWFRFRNRLWANTKSISLSITCGRSPWRPDTMPVRVLSHLSEISGFHAGKVSNALPRDLLPGDLLLTSSFSLLSSSTCTSCS